MNDDDLDRQLRAWEVEPDIPANFRADVWAKIATSETGREDSVWSHLARILQQMLIRPVHASAFVAVFLMMSLGGAYVHSDRANAQHFAELQSRYAAAIDPYSHRTQD